MKLLDSREFPLIFGSVDQFLLGVSPEVSGSLVNELAVFLDITSRFWEAEGIGFALPQSWALMDELWHSAILCTSEYQNFSSKSAGHWVDHFPEARLNEGLDTFDYNPQWNFLNRNLSDARYRLWLYELPRIAPVWKVCAIKANHVVPDILRRKLAFDLVRSITPSLKVLAN